MPFCLAIVASCYCLCLVVKFHFGLCLCTKLKPHLLQNILESPELEDRNDRILGAIGYELIEEPDEVFEELNILKEKKCPEQGVVQGIKHDAEQVAIKLLATRLKLSTTS